MFQRFISISCETIFMGILLRVVEIKKLRGVSTGIIHTRLNVGVCRLKSSVLGNVGGPVKKGLLGHSTSRFALKEERVRVLTDHPVT